MNKIHFIVKQIAVIVVFTSIFGCTAPIGELGTNSHFVYPNSNVQPLGNVTAETSRTKWFSNYVDEQMLDEVMTKVLSQKGGDFLTDFKIVTTTQTFPFLPLSTVTLRISGTAVKANIGKKDILNKQ